VRQTAVVLLTLHAALTATAAAQRGIVPQAAALQGVVLADDTAAPLRRARVLQQSADGVIDVAYSDDRGRFLLPAAPAADSVVTVSKPGYAAQRFPRDARATGDLVVRLVRGAAFTATVLETVGDPATGVGIRLERVDTDGLSAVERYYFTDTDDRGEARIGSLPSGQYRLTLADSLAAARTELAVPLPMRETSEPEPRVELGPAQEVSVTRVFQRDPRLSGLRGSVGPMGAAVAETNAIIAGRVVDPNGRPMAGVTVRVMHVAIGSERQGMTNETGIYEVPGVAPGLVRVSPRFPGPMGLALEPFLARNAMVAPREQRGMDFVVPRGSVAEGVVVDAEGEPIEGAAVQLWRVRARGVRTAAERASEVFTRRTDDRGRFRLYGIVPGSYYVLAVEEVPTGDPFATIPTIGRAFFPDSTGIAGASLVAIGADQTLSGVTIAFPSTPLARVHGRITTSVGQPFRGSVALAPSSRSGVADAGARRTQVSDGTFAFANVAPGDYVVKATAATEPGFSIREPADDPRESAVTFLTVAGGDVPVFLQTGAGSILRGQIVVEGERVGQRVPDITIEAVPADPDLAPEITRRTTQPAADGSFEVKNVSGPVRIMVSGTPPGWWLKSVMIDGIDAALEPVALGRPNQSRSGVEVVLATTGAEISGTVGDSAEMKTGAVVVAYPTDLRRWFDRSPYFRLAPVERDGRFALSGMPPGEYLIVAIDAADINPLSDEWQSPDLLSTLADRAQRVTLREGGRVTTAVIRARARP
jgi:protocatechuate 3,4-dioxygenase beta subunit